MEADLTDVSQGDRAFPEPASSPGWEYTLQRDVEVKRQVRLQIVVRRVAAHRCQRLRGHRHGRQIHCVVELAAGGAVQRFPRRRGHAAQRSVLRQHEVVVCGNLTFQQGDRLRTAGFAQIMERKARALAGMHGCAPLQIWQCEVGLAIAPIGGPEERKEGRVLQYRHELAITPGPAFRREVEWKNPDFSHERVCHKNTPGWIGFDSDSSRWLREYSEE